MKDPNYREPDPGMMICLGHETCVRRTWRLVQAVLALPWIILAVTVIPMLSFPLLLIWDGTNTRWWPDEEYRVVNGVRAEKIRKSHDVIWPNWWSRWFVWAPGKYYCGGCVDRREIPGGG
jgi:hypothetical protein